MKATSKFLIKGIYLILLIVAITIVTNQIMSINSTAKEELETIKFRKEASDILETLISSEKCLATEKMGTIEKIINISTLEDFQLTYPEIEPNCARSYEYGYYVKVEKFNFTKISGSYEPKMSPGNRDIVLILDNSGSMADRFEAAKSAAIQFVNCADETDRVAIVTFNSGFCGAGESIPLTPISTGKDALIQQMVFDTEHGTPLINSLKEAERILHAPGIQDNRIIILFTDGRESCCDACANQGFIVGTEDCLNPCRTSLCDFAESDLQNQGIPIYSIFLGNETAGIEQTKCTSEKTGGKFYNISEENIDVLGKVFCRIIERERETNEGYQSWYFGSKNHSIDKALEKSVTISIPVTIQISDTKAQPGLATIRLYKGQLEELVGSIDGTCGTELEIRKKIYISYPVKLEGNSICIDNTGRKSCRKFACDNVEFAGIDLPGMYEFYFKKENGVVKVIV